MKHWNRASSGDQLIANPLLTPRLSRTDFAAKDGRQLKLEIEPGTYLSANSGALVCLVHDIVQTGTDQGHTFIKLDSGMTEVLRPSLYGAQHPIIIVPKVGVA